MSEYWVSQAKHYCKVCNCYIADNKTSIAHHENGSKHKEKVEILQKQKRQDKLHGARSEVELKQQLAEIEKAAKEAIAVDRAEQGGYFYQVGRHTACLHTKPLSHILSTHIYPTEHKRVWPSASSACAQASRCPQAQSAH